MNLAHAIEERVEAGLPVTSAWLEETRRLLTPAVPAVAEKKAVAPKKVEPAVVEAKSSTAVTPDTKGSRSSTAVDTSTVRKPRAPSSSK